MRLPRLPRSSFFLAIVMHLAAVNTCFPDGWFFAKLELGGAQTERNPLRSPQLPSDLAWDLPVGLGDIPGLLVEKVQAWLRQSVEQHELFLTIFLFARLAMAAQNSERDPCWRPPTGTKSSASEALSSWYYRRHHADPKKGILRSDRHTWELETMHCQPWDVTGHSHASPHLSELVSSCFVQDIHNHTALGTQGTVGDRGCFARGGHLTHF